MYELHYLQEYTGCTVEDHLKPVQMFLGGFNHDSVAMIYAAQNNCVNQYNSGYSI